MIEILLKNKKFIKAQTVDEIPLSSLDFHVMQFLDYGNTETQWLEKNFGLDFTIMKHYEDIEISSHFLENDKQAAFHFSLPFYNDEKKIIEQPIFIIISHEGLFLFSSSKLDNFLNKTYANKFRSLRELGQTAAIFEFQFGFISDYFADITESLSRKIKALASTVLIEKKFANNEMDSITEYNFSNLLVKELLIETTRVFRMYLKSNWEQKMDLKESIRNDLNDLAVVSDYIQFNFDRLDDLKENISSKINLEQNHIFKMLTVATVCISLPTLIAGIYGMNFEEMPELKNYYGYPVVLLAMLFAAILPFIYFKRKRWL
ncbi:CorA family divalent cation transporter [Flavobacterium sp. TMP13]|uniref:CorA family divalent cation transporter n=1 Tax=unclassified Flavobacterium TaxID=196869 RepID=UPI00076D2F28|nr:CorA family divalent cation transporter [Flavobacterium sp. TAB 87]KVV15637.1 Magnesium transport protein CorA [Flavobacterium sp. TAB 87]